MHACITTSKKFCAKAHPCVMEFLDPVQISAEIAFRDELRQAASAAQDQEDKRRGLTHGRRQPVAVQLVSLLLRAMSIAPTYDAAPVTPAMPYVYVRLTPGGGVTFQPLRHAEDA